MNIKPNDGGFKLDANNPIGSVEALLTSGPDASLPAGQLGAQVEDLADRFTAFARVEGLRLVDVTTGPGDAVAGHVKLAQHAAARALPADGPDDRRRRCRRSRAT